MSSQGQVLQCVMCDIAAVLETVVTVLETTYSSDAAAFIAVQLLVAFLWS